MKFKMLLAAAVAVVAFGPATIAQEDPVRARQAIMKDIGAQSKTVGDMLQGKAPFDAVVAKAALEKIAANATEYPDHFPPGSEVGDTEAMPSIWQNKPDFEARAEKLAADAGSAAAAVDTGEDAFRQSTGAMFGNCKGCHEVYRKPS